MNAGSGGDGDASCGEDGVCGEVVYACGGELNELETLGDGGEKVCWGEIGHRCQVGGGEPFI